MHRYTDRRGAYRCREHPATLVKVNPATGSGARVGVTHIRRVQACGGMTPVGDTRPWGIAETGQREVVKYQADGIFRLGRLRRGRAPATMRH
jgi:hypothetical protein